MSSTPERRAEAQISYREIHYSRVDHKITQAQYEQAMREWQAIYPDFMPGDGCCGNISTISEGS